MERIICDRGVAFTSNLLKEYCENENIQHLLINGQVERINKIVISMLAKLCADIPQHWYMYIDQIQQCINNTAPRSTNIEPFKILTGVNMRTPNLTILREVLEQCKFEEFNHERDLQRTIPKENIFKIQEENRKSFNKRRIKANCYKPGDLVAIKRTQFGPGLKLKPKFH